MIKIKFISCIESILKKSNPFEVKSKFYFANIQIFEHLKQKH